MKENWTDDAELIKQELDSLVDNKAELICGRRNSEGGGDARMPLVAKTSTKTGPLFVLFHPHDTCCNAETCIFYYHTKNNPLRVFEAKRVKKADKFLGFEYPKEIANIHRRKFERVTTPNNSIVTFIFQRRQRIHYGSVGDISLEGAKLIVDVPGEIEKGTILCHINITVCYRISKVETALVIPEAEVIWSKSENEVTNAIGIKFNLSDRYQEALSKYIDLRSIEESYQSN